MKRIYVIGSIKQIDEIEMVAESIIKNSETDDIIVDHVYPEPNKDFSDIVSSCFDKIDEADEICAVSKHNGTFGHGTTYEMEYAKRKGKNLRIFI